MKPKLEPLIAGWYTMGDFSISKEGKWVVRDDEGYCGSFRRLSDCVTFVEREHRRLNRAKRRNKK